MDEEPQKFDPQSLMPEPQPGPDLDSLLEQLDSTDRDTRLEAIDALSRLGDEGALEALRDAGNSVVVVEHDPAIIRRADYVVDMGPGDPPPAFDFDAYLDRADWPAGWA